MIAKSEGSNPSRMRVTFSIPPSLWATEAHLVGDFNNWDRRSHPLVRSSLHSAWQITLELERRNQYQYRYLLEGRKWCNDSNADRYVPNPFGGTNSVVET